MCKILIASDRETSRDRLKSVCIARGYSICAETGQPEQALILSELHLPDIVIFNFRCALRTQILIVAQIAQIGRSVKVLVYSTLGPSRSTQAYIRAGASGFLSEDDNDKLTTVLQGMAAGFTMVPINALKQPRVKLAHRDSSTFIDRQRPLLIPLAAPSPPGKTPPQD
ncbi:response regulator [Pseudomonas sp. GV071]|jgi:DNA-binding NarL/FixJ family response regulator|uniref:response regulator n=1 Tax=Pseudomonas sp. GV071 TaxID=2135754 RepID=UPI000D384B2C|nr:response regulator [Pseudomonas sp. GV071]PTQ68510.1 response regulator receiver domain-containing protein [Pseudomonas sp. GV071]